MEKQPNILFIMADQMSALALGAYGNPVAQTPHIQSLADNGVVFRNAYCNSPLCAPSRASMLTGKLPSQIGAYDNAADFPSSTPTFNHFLRHMGYRTCLSGKMHFTGPDQLHGYEERLTTDIYPADFGWTCDWERPVEKRFSWYHNMQSVTDAGVCVRSNQLDFDEAVAHRAVSWLYDQARSNDPRPFCLTVSFTHPHDPYNITRKYWDRYDPADIDRLYTDPIPLEDLDAHSRRVARICNLDPTSLTRRQFLDARRAYYGAVSYIDDKVGELLHTLSETGLKDNTVIVLTSDHGDMLGDRGLWYKMTFFEWSARVPLIVSAPDRFPGRIVDENVSLLNLFPTLVDLGSNHAPPHYAGGINQESLMPFLEGGTQSRPAPVVAEYLAEGAVAPCFMVLEDRFKYIFSEADPPLLFDLANDPGERRNLAGTPEYRTRENALHNELESRWDWTRLRRDIIDNQRQRRIVFQSQMQGHHFPWDHQPHEDASRQYMRNHLLLDDLELNRRLLPANKDSHIPSLPGEAEMTDATFEKMTLSDRPLYGPEKLILCGFSADIQPKFEAVLDMAGLKQVPRVWALEDQRETSLSDLAALPPNAGQGESSTLPRAIIVAGITERQLQTLMAVCRKTGMQQALWATLTPTSETWQLKDLLAELAAERKALQK